MEDGQPVALMTDQLPAPDFTLELAECKCKKTKCSDKRCACFKLNLKCSEACGCIDCENEDTGFEDIDDD